MDPTSSSTSVRHSLRPFVLKDTSSYPRRNSDFFRSRLPNDPFSNSASSGRAPIVVNSERLHRAVSDSHATRHVIVVIGGQCFLSKLPSFSHSFLDVTLDPSSEDLAPLLYSERLAFSLLIIATHQPPSILFKVQPAVRILRLVEPLALDQFGAVRLVNVFEWAERVARTWRKIGGIGVEEVSEYNQEVEFGTLAPPRVHRSRTESNSSSFVSHPDSTSSALSTSSLSNLFLRVKHRLRTEGGPPPVDPSQRPFDALVNYLPSSISDKAILKQAILVTTVSRPFLIAATLSSIRPQGKHLKRMSVYSTSPLMLSSNDSIDGLLAGSTGPTLSNDSPNKAHLVHLLPRRPHNSVADRLIDSIESFLLSFSFPSSLEIRDTSPAMEPARTCLLEATAFAEPVGTPLSLSINWTVADALLSGLLDDEQTPRVRLSGACDVVISALPPPPSLTPLRAVHLGRHTPSSPASTPELSPPSSNSPSPRHSEVSMSYRRFSLFNKTKSEQRSWGWKLWPRISTATPLAR